MISKLKRDFLVLMMFFVVQQSLFAMSGSPYSSEMNSLIRLGHRIDPLGHRVQRRPRVRRPLPDDIGVVTQFRRILFGDTGRLNLGDHSILQEVDALSVLNLYRLGLERAGGVDAISMEEFQEGEDVFVTNCGHLFRLESLEGWLNTRYRDHQELNCPYCRREDDLIVYGPFPYTDLNRNGVIVPDGSESSDDSVVSDGSESSDDFLDFDIEVSVEFFDSLYLD